MLSVPGVAAWFSTIPGGGGKRNQPSCIDLLQEEQGLRWISHKLACSWGFTGDFHSGTRNHRRRGALAAAPSLGIGHGGDSPRRKGRVSVRVSASGLNLGLSGVNAAAYAITGFRNSRAFSSILDEGNIGESIFQNMNFGRTWLNCRWCVYTDRSNEYPNRLIALAPYLPKWKAKYRSAGSQWLYVRIIRIKFCFTQWVKTTRCWTYMQVLLVLQSLQLRD